ncbi:MAG: hypothetical protein WD749_11755 [Phycisphaerales bacterium]
MRAAAVWMIAAVCGLATFAASMVTRAPKLVDSRGNPVRPLMRTMAASGMLPRDIPALLEFITQSPEHLRARYWLALRYTWSGRTAEAREAWRAAADLVPRLIELEPQGRRAPFAHFVLGEARRELGEHDGGLGAYEASLRMYGAVLERRPQDATVIYYMAWCCHRMGDQIGAGKYWRLVEELEAEAGERGDADSFYRLAAARAMLGKTDAALGAVDALLKRGFNDRLMLGAAEEFAALREEPRFRAALTRMEEQEQSGPPPPAAAF